MSNFDEQDFHDPNPIHLGIADRVWEFAAKCVVGALMLVFLSGFFV